MEYQPRRRSGCTACNHHLPIPATPKRQSMTPQKSKRNSLVLSTPLRKTIVRSASTGLLTPKNGFQIDTAKHVDTKKSFECLSPLNYKGKIPTPTRKSIITKPSLMDIMNTNIPIPKRLIPKSVDLVESDISDKKQNVDKISERRGSNETLVGSQDGLVADHAKVLSVEVEELRPENLLDLQLVPGNVETTVEIPREEQVTLEIPKDVDQGALEILQEMEVAQQQMNDFAIADSPVQEPSMAQEVSSGRFTPVNGRTTPHDLHQYVEPNYTTIATEPIPEYKTEKRKFKQRNLDLMRDLSGLTLLLSAKHDELLSYHAVLSSNKNAKVEYIHTARDIYDISTNIVKSWKPVTLCSDSKLSQQLTDSLVKVEVLCAQLKSVTNGREYQSEDRDEGKQIISCSHNLVRASVAALSDLEAANLRLES